MGASSPPSSSSFFFFFGKRKRKNERRRGRKEEGGKEGEERRRRTTRQVNENGADRENVDVRSRRGTARTRRRYGNILQRRKRKERAKGPEAQRGTKHKENRHESRE